MTPRPPTLPPDLLPLDDRPPLRADEIGSILFMCNFNVIRSPMAAAMTRHYFGHRYYVESAGIRRDGDHVSPFAAEVMDELGLDIRAHLPRGLDQVEDGSFDLIVTLSPEAHHRALDWSRTMACDVEYWPTLDPTLVTGSRESILDSYRAVRDGLKEKILTRFEASPSPGL